MTNVLQVDTGKDESCEKLTAGFGKLLQLVHLCFLPCFFPEEQIGKKVNGKENMLV